ncbi:hypothetical protein EIP91_009835 [Steccherinum ochraceum]|uniref:Uncharacterized protein n=1 Tax=Steccherinum ochraceum TaxID=92696 RepID=A0A4R0R172_9APHY|nr:hypothetical protein EIP91_009835 [Steccherinum ochraceum]
MLASRVRAIHARPPLRPTPLRTQSSRFRWYSQQPAKQSDLSSQPAFSAQRYLQHTAFTVDFFRRFVKFTAIGLFAVGLSTWTAFEGAHMYVESVKLALNTDPDVRKWEWDVEAERWARGRSGGTDPGLSFKGRHAVRAAWMAQNWGIGSSDIAPAGGMSGKASPGNSNGGLNVVEARLVIAQAFLAVALDYAAKHPDKLLPHTMVELRQRNASILEHMGTKEALFAARRDLEKVWAGQPGRGIDAARTALKLGDLNQRLGDGEDAMAWWARSVQLTQEQDSSKPIEIPPPVPSSAPSSPLAQRTLITTLVSLSAFYATSGQLKQAQAVEESALDLLRSIPQPKSFETAAPSEALHALYILHRSSLLSIHLAEVLYALRNKQPTSMEWLARAAESSERVALTLTGLPPVHPDAPQSRIPHPPSSETPLIPSYAKSAFMQKPASSLLRDARRTAAEAWNLMGLLIEASDAPESQKRAFECYERAVGWAGVAHDRAGGVAKAGEGITEVEWKALWNNYVRTRNTVKNIGSK